MAPLPSSEHGVTTVLQRFAERPADQQFIVDHQHDDARANAASRLLSCCHHRARWLRLRLVECPRPAAVNTIAERRALDLQQFCRTALVAPLTFSAQPMKLASTSREPLVRAR